MIKCIKIPFFFDSFRPIGNFLNLINDYDQLGQPLRLHHQSGRLPFFRQPFIGSKDIICRKE